jgi:hypothetical protein
MPIYTHPIATDEKVFYKENHPCMQTHAHQVYQKQSETKGRKWYSSLVTISR